MTTVRLFVLGIVRREQRTHGYKVHRELAAWRADKWTSLKPGSIYHALSQLEKEGFVQSAGTQESKIGPSRKAYTLTRMGTKEFLKIEKSVLQNDDLNIELFAAGLAFMEALGRAEALLLLKTRHQTLVSTAEFMHSLPVNDNPPNPSELPPLVGLWSGFFDQLVIHSADLIRDIESGRYVFEDEEK